MKEREVGWVSEVLVGKKVGDLVGEGLLRILDSVGFSKEIVVF